MTEMEREVCLNALQICLDLKKQLWDQIEIFENELQGCCLDFDYLTEGVLATAIANGIDPWNDSQVSILLDEIIEEAKGG